VEISADTEALRRILRAKSSPRSDRSDFRTGLTAFDDVAPGGCFQNGAVHELLWKQRSSSPKSVALCLAKAARSRGGKIVWSDPRCEVHLPALVASGINLRHLILLRYASRQDELSALAECLQNRGISATVATLSQLSRVEARRLQLAAERGGGVGIFMRPYAAATSSHYAAATRWLIQPNAGNDNVQRWSVELLHGHGGRIGQVVLLEADRDTRALRISEPMADRPAAPAAARASA
jgi:protein ImuA